jgi:hypothetical protein
LVFFASSEELVKNNRSDDDDEEAQMNATALSSTLTEDGEAFFNTVLFVMPNWKWLVLFADISNAASPLAKFWAYCCIVLCTDRSPPWWWARSGIH